jgi:hypothetical protein
MPLPSAAGWWEAAPLHLTRHNRSRIPHPAERIIAYRSILVISHRAKQPGRGLQRRRWALQRGHSTAVADLSTIRHAARNQDQKLPERPLQRTTPPCAPHTLLPRGPIALQETTSSPRSGQEAGTGRPARNSGPCIGRPCRGRGASPPPSARAGHRRGASRPNVGPACATGSDGRPPQVTVGQVKTRS